MRQGLGRCLLTAAGFAAFGLGWVGIFLPGLPTTIFWIVAALIFMRMNEGMYRRVVSHPRFGPAVRRFVEEGSISRKGKFASIGAMMGFAALGSIAMPPLWLKALVLGTASAGSLWVAFLPFKESHGTGRAAEAERLPLKPTPSCTMGRRSPAPSAAPRAPRGAS